MGLLDGLLGNVLGGMMGGGAAAGQQGQNPLLQAALQMLQQNGGLQGILGKFQRAGYGAQADSWVSTGQNQPIDANALQQVLGQGQLEQIAQQLGMSHGDAAGGLASMLPQLIDQMTPQGQVPGNHNDMVSQALAMLTKKSA
ncbi:MAG: YidB family protein [Betaproteobacteria bacterium]